MGASLTSGREGRPQRVSAANVYAVQRKVPLILHRIWLDDPMPDQVIAYGESFAKWSLPLEIIDWTDSQSLPGLINQDLFDNAHEIFPKDWRRFQSDLLRLELLYLFGGTYVDTDVECHGHLNGTPGLMHNGGFLAGRSPQERGGEHPITNCVMFSSPGHPFVAHCIRTLPESVKAHRKTDLAMCAGPWHLTREYAKKNWDAVTIMSHEEFFDGNTVFTHHWNNGRRQRGEGLF